MRWQIEGAYNYGEEELDLEGEEELDWEVDYIFDNPKDANQKYEELIKSAGKYCLWRLSFLDATVMKKNY